MEWAPFGRSRVTCLVKVTTTEGRADWSAERAVRAVARALAELGWVVHEPRGESDGALWDASAERSGYAIGILMHQKEGLMYLNGGTPGFRVPRWEVPGA